MIVQHAETQEPTVELVSVDPVTATKWLEANTHNRPVRDGWVRELASDMAGGRWRLNGETIKFDQEGTLIDGQHRLWAVLTSEATVPIMVVTGLPVGSQDTVDIGRNRSTANVLSLDGTANSTKVSAIAKVNLWYLRANAVLWSAQNSPTKTEIVDYAREHDALLQDAAMAQNAVGSVGLNSSPYGLLYCLAQRGAHADKWADFHEGVRTGANLSRGDARLALRNYAMKRTPSYGKWDMQNLAAVCIKSWNDYVKGVERFQLRFGKDELPMPRAL